MKSADFSNKIILVTGGVGSIGLEIVKQLLKLSPSQVRIYDNRETELFHIKEELKSHESIRFLIGDVRDRDRLMLAMENVDIVFHAAALKHVPLCEYNPFEAVKTNVLGTQNVIDCAKARNVKKVINISTDKVTNAINTLGATKLLAERLIASAQYSRGTAVTRFASVRFGNVIGSRGSVVDLFVQQIQRGGPVTLTNSEMTRFVMSIPQAVQLVLHAASILQGGEIFILKMPVFKLLDLTQLLIEEVSKTLRINPESIKIQTIGLRPGEKKFEELMTQEEAESALETPELFMLFPEINYDDFEGVKKKFPDAKKTDVKSYSSNTPHLMTKPELKKLLQEQNLI